MRVSQQPIYNIGTFSKAQGSKTKLLEEGRYEAVCVGAYYPLLEHLAKVAWDTLSGMAGPSIMDVKFVSNFHKESI